MSLICDFDWKGRIILGEEDVVLVEMVCNIYNMCICDNVKILINLFEKFRNYYINFVCVCICEIIWKLFNDELFFKFEY